MKRFVLTLLVLVISGGIGWGGYNGINYYHNKWSAEAFQKGGAFIIESCFDGAGGRAWQNDDTGHAIVCLGVPPSNGNSEAPGGSQAPSRGTPDPEKGQLIDKSKQEFNV